MSKTTQLVATSVRTSGGVVRFLPRPNGSFVVIAPKPLGATFAINPTDSGKFTAKFLGANKEDHAGIDVTARTPDAVYKQVARQLLAA